MPVRITVWNEFEHEKENERVRAVYPKGIHESIKEGLAPLGDFEIRTATLEEPEHGLTLDVLATTDTLIWWGHKAHDKVADEIVDRVCAEVLSGMGLIALHSAHFSKVFRRLMGTNCSLKWREADERERLWNIRPSHPIMAGVDEYIELQQAEMYGEPFDIPTPDDLLLISWFQGGEVFRSGCTWKRGNGRVFYFRPGHEVYPIYYDPNVLRIIANGCVWAGRRLTRPTDACPNTLPLESLD
jgi:trehalose utilization protein